MLDDRSAVEQARRGDDRAWRVLYDRHADLVFRLAHRIVGEREAALDIVQDTYVQAASAIHGFRGDSSFRSWLASIALNAARTHVRRRARRREVGFDAVGEPAASGRPADAAVADADLADRALAFARSLPDQQRDAVLLRVIEGLSYREIARALGTSAGSVRVSYHHGIHKLREYMTAWSGAREADATGRHEAARDG
ncbi:MAG: RNA polymerase sigma factor [Gemmatimonadota bacterium]